MQFPPNIKAKKFQIICVKYPNETTDKFQHRTIELLEQILNFMQNKRIEQTNEIFLKHIVHRFLIEIKLLFVQISIKQMERPSND